MTDKHEPQPHHQLLVMTDPTGHKIAEKLFDLYMVGDEAKRKGKADYRRKPEFCIALDRLVSQFGGNPIPDDEPMQRTDADGNGDRGYDDDQDIHEASYLEVTSVKDAIVKLLAKK